jgi:hypothetical protein
MHEELRNAYKIFSEDMKGRDQLGDISLCINGRII